MDESRSEDEVFVVRLWYERSRTGSAMRGQIDHPVSGRRRYFANLGELCDFLLTTQGSHHAKDGEA